MESPHQLFAKKTLETFSVLEVGGKPIWGKNIRSQIETDEPKFGLGITPGST